MDVEATAAEVAAVAFYNAGQDCTAAARLLVHASIHDAFVDAFAKQVAALRTGPVADTDFGLLNSAAQLRVRQ